MIDTIKTVSGFAHNDNSNIFSNILVINGIITAQNDMCGISLDIDVDDDFCCNARSLLNVVKNCDPEKIKMSVKNGFLNVSSGRLKSKIQTVPTGSYPIIDQSGDPVKVQSDIIKAMSGMSVFSDPNDVRMALRGVELSSESINATNGHMAVKKEIEKIDIDKSVVIPSKSILIMSKVNAIIDTISMNSNFILFNFDDGYMFSKFIDQKMPDIDRILSDIENKTNVELLRDSIKSIHSMCGNDKTVIFGESIKTRDGNTSIDGFNLNDSAFNSEYLLKIFDIADDIDISKYPASCPFEGDGIRGAIIGVII